MPDREGAEDNVFQFRWREAVGRHGRLNPRVRPPPCRPESVAKGAFGNVHKATPAALRQGVRAAARRLRSECVRRSAPALLLGRGRPHGLLLGRRLLRTCGEEKARGALHEEPAAATVAANAAVTANAAAANATSVYASVPRRQRPLPAAAKEGLEIGSTCAAPPERRRGRPRRVDEARAKDRVGKEAACGGERG